LGEDLKVYRFLVVGFEIENRRGYSPKRYFLHRVLCMFSILLNTQQRVLDYGFRILVPRLLWYWVPKRLTSEA